LWYARRVPPADDRLVALAKRRRSRALAITEEIRARLAPHRRVLLVLLGLGLVALAWSVATNQARLQVPLTFPDSIVYLQTANQPFALDHLFYPKPLTIPAIYRLFDSDTASIATFQLQFAIVAWILFGLVLCISLRRTAARVASVVITFAFLLASHRIGFASSILSESINDSLATLALALGLGLALVLRLAPGRARSGAIWSITALLAITITAWLLARDSNAIVALAGVPIAVVVWRIHRSWRDVPWAVGLAACVVLASAFAVWTTRVAPTPPTNLTLHINFPPSFYARTVFPIANNIFLRILPDPTAREFFVAHGLPQADELAKVSWGTPDNGLFTDPQLEPARQWIATRGSSVYMRWLLAHPVDRADEMARQLWDVLASDEIRRYMPHGNIYVWGFPYWTIRAVTTSELVLLALLLAAPLALRRPRRHLVTAIATVLIGSGVLGAAASYFGDAYEPGRHMWGAGQQIVLGLFLAPLAWLDRDRSARGIRSARQSGDAQTVG
jgi:hypothetical protein